MRHIISGVEMRSVYKNIVLDRGQRFILQCVFNKRIIDDIYVYIQMEVTDAIYDTSINICSRVW